VLREIARCVPAGVPLSIALGEPKNLAALEAAMAALHGLDPTPSQIYVKVGLSAAGDGAGARLAALVELASRTGTRPSVIAVAYADYAAAGAPAPETVVRLAADTGADGVLLDTWGKDGRALLTFAPFRDHSARSVTRVIPLTIVLSRSTSSSKAAF
jgi:uncharacterized protein (UPF0264 family)